MLFFLDESGQDHGSAPYEVTAAIAIPENQVWPFHQAVRALEQECFGLALHSIGKEVKGKTFLQTKRFKQAALLRTFGAKERRRIVKRFLQNGYMHSTKTGPDSVAPPTVTKVELVAYAQACIAFATKMLRLGGKYDIRVFASIVPHRSVPSTKSGFLRRDHRYLLHRFSHFVEGTSSEESGLLVFDEMERQQCRRLMSNFENYVNGTVAGYEISERVIPTPFFVRSDLTVAVQFADVCAYCINWGVRLKNMDVAPRKEIVRLARQVRRLEYRAQRPDELGTKWTEYGIFYVEDLAEPKKRRGSKTSSSPLKGQEAEHEASRPMSSLQQLNLFGDTSSPGETNQRGSRGKKKKKRPS